LVDTGGITSAACTGVIAGVIGIIVTIAAAQSSSRHVAALGIA
jgi:hypothetical protein